MNLEYEGYGVTWARDLRTANKENANAPFDLAILDLRLGEESGMQILAEMRARGVQIPTLMITAHGSVRDAVQAMRLGAIDFLQKPIDPVTLRAAVVEILDRCKTWQEQIEQAGPEEILREAKRLINLQDFAQAGRKVSEALEINADSPDAHNLQGILHEIAGDYAAARDCYWRALEIDPQHSAAQGNMRRYSELHSVGRSEEPIRYEPTPDDGSFHEGLA